MSEYNLGDVVNLEETIKLKKPNDLYYELYDLAKKTLVHNGCDEINAENVAITVTNAERDGSISHGLFRIPGYVAALRSKKVKGNARPSNQYLTQNIIRVDGGEDITG